MFGFGKPKKDEGKSVGSFGLPGLSLGKAENAFGQGLGQASNTLKNTGEKVEDFLFGHSENNKEKKNNGEGGGFGLPGLSLGKAEKSIGNGLGQASNTIQKTGKKVDDFLFGHSKKQKDSNELSIGLPGGSLNLGFGGSSSILNNVGDALNKTEVGLEKTGEETIDYLFGKNKKKPKTNLPDLSFGGVGIPNISDVGKKTDEDIGKLGKKIDKTGGKAVDYIFGKGKPGSGSSIGKTGTNLGLGGGLDFGLGSSSNVLNNVGDAMNKTEMGLEKTGEETIDYLFGKNKKKPKTNLPDLSFGGIGIPNISDVAKKADEDIGKLGKKVDKSGGKAVDYIFGKGKPDSGSSIGKTGTNVGLGGSLNFGLGSSSNVLNNVGNALNKTEMGLEKTGEETIDYLFGKNKKKPKTYLPDLSFGGIGIPNISDVGKKTDEDIEKLGKKVDKTGGKVVDHILGKVKPEEKNIIDSNLRGLSGTAVVGSLPTSPSLSLGGTATPSLSDVGKKMNEDLGKIGNNVEKTGGKVIDYIFGKEKPTNGSSDIVKNIDKDIGNPDNKVEKAGEKTIDYIFGKGKSTSSIENANESTNIPNASVRDKDLGVIGHKVEKTGGKVVDYIFGKGKSTDSELSTDTSTSPIPNTDLSGLKSKTFGTDDTRAEIPPNINANKSKDLLLPTSSSLQPVIPPVSMPNIANGGTTNGQLDVAVSGVSESTLDAKNTFGSKVEDDKLLPKITTSTKFDGSLDFGKSTTGSTDTPVPVKNDEEVTSSFEATDDHTVHSFEFNTGKTLNSLEESANGLFGASEHPPKITKSEETLKKIEDILQGSGTTTSSLGQNTRTKGPKLGKKPKTPEFTYDNEVSNEDSTTINTNNHFDVSILEEVGTTTEKPGPVVLPPYFIVPNRNITIGEQKTPKLPPTAFDKPTGEKAPFIPVLPPSMETSTPNVMAPSTPYLIPHTTMPPTTGSLTPVEYGGIGIGCVLIFALVAYIYQKYKQLTTSSSGGSYSPKSQHKTAAGRKKSTRSDDSEGGQSLEMDEVVNISTTEAQINTSNPDEVVVDVTTLKVAEEVVETPITKTVANELQRSCENEKSYQNPDSIEVISEKTTKSVEKPPRRSKTPSDFTSDKTAASSLNQDSLKTVSQALGGILKDQTNQPTNEDLQQEAESIDDPPEGVSLIGKLVELKTIDDGCDKTPEDSVNEQLETEKVEEQDGNIDNDPLYKSLETEMDAGSEYYSADEHSDSKKTPPPSPLQNRKFERVHLKSLRAEDVYNTEIITEDGRRRSIEEDIAESIERTEENISMKNESTTHKIIQECNTDEDAGKSAVIVGEEKIGDPSDNIQVESTGVHNTPDSIKDNEDKVEDTKLEENNLPSTTIEAASNLDYGGDIGEFLKPSAPPLRQETDNPSKYSSASVETNQTELPKEVHEGNLKNSYPYKIEAEAIVDDIIRTSQLDLLTLHSIQKDLGSSEKEVLKVPLSEDHSKPDCELQEDRGLNSYKNSEIKMKDPLAESNTSEKAALKTEESSASDGLANVNSELKFEEYPGEPFQVSILSNNPDIMQTTKLENTKIEENKSCNSAGSITTCIDTPTQNPASLSEDLRGMNEEIDSLNEGFIVEHKFEFIPPRQPKIFEDDLIVLCDSERGSISTISNSTAGANEEEIVKKEEAENNDENHSKWYVPNDDTSDPNIASGVDRSGENLYIVLTEESNINTPSEIAASPSKSSESNSMRGSPRRSRRELNNFSNISYAYIEVTDDPRNEGWPEHLPKNIHSVSGVGLVKSSGNGLYDALKEEVSEASTSESTQTTTAEDASIKSSINQKPIPKFIIPNMDGRLTRRRTSRRRQIKSLDSGVHHYYGEYLDLVEFPEIENDEQSKKNKDKKEEVIEEVLTIKPDGTLTEEKIVIQNSQ